MDTRGRKLREVTRETIGEYLKKRKARSILRPSPPKKLKKREKRKKLAAATLNNDIRDLRSFFKFCMLNEWVGHSPLLAVQNFAGQMRRRVRMLTPAEEERLIDACRHSYIVEVMAKRNKGSRAGGKVSAEKAKFTQTVPRRSSNASPMYRPVARRRRSSPDGMALRSSAT